MTTKELESTLRFEIKVRDDRWAELKNRIQQLMWCEESQEAFKQDHSILITPYIILKIMDELEEK